MTIGEWLVGSGPTHSDGVVLYPVMYFIPRSCQGRPGHQSKVKLAGLFCGGGGGAPAGSSLPSDMLDFQVATFYIVNQDKYSVLVGFKHFYGSRNIVK